MQKLPVALAAVHEAVDQPHQPQALVPASGQQTKQKEREHSLPYATGLLLSLAVPWPIQMQRNAVLAAVKKAVVGEQRVDEDDAPCKYHPKAI